MYGMYRIHNETMKAGEEALAKHNAVSVGGCRHP